MKALPITPKAADPLIEAYEIRMSKLHDYLRPDGLNSVIKPIVQEVKSQPIVRQHVYFKPTTNILHSTLDESVGKKIDFRFG